MADDRPLSGPRRSRTARVARAGAAIVLGVLGGLGPAGASSAAASPALTCTYIPLTSWQAGFMADLQIRNNGPEITSWSVRMVFPMQSDLVQAWSAVMTQSTPYEMTAVNASWNGKIPTGIATTFGWSARGAIHDVPTEITINGLPC